MWIVDDCRELVPIQTEEWLREEVAAVHVFFAFGLRSFPCAGVDSIDWRTVAVHSVSLAVLDKREKDFAQRVEVWGVAGRVLLK